MTFAERIDAIIINRGTTRKIVATACGIDVSTIATWKRRDTIPGADTAVRIAGFLGVTVEYLVTGREAGLPKYEALLRTRPVLRSIVDRLAVIPDRELSRLNPVLDAVFPESFEVNAKESI